jgi:hypothetical protein
MNVIVGVRTRAQMDQNGEKIMLSMDSKYLKRQD